MKSNIVNNESKEGYDWKIVRGEVALTFSAMAASPFNLTTDEREGGE